MGVCSWHIAQPGSPVKMVYGKSMTIGVRNDKNKAKIVPICVEGKPTNFFSKVGLWVSSPITKLQKGVACDHKGDTKVYSGKGMGVDYDVYLDMGGMVKSV